ncbi:hypothetical protein MKK70_21480 [Methylobacterium sp. E-041]|uniref:hypothetical protein n=1 Tax=Methylobacterium sp. E-041 TaxID=2836573 RepID=UPI001FBA060B|nr:hypothetical protein [Methylobacterium sp. E-041]MCJ2107901.1 hypothetical protein [Methylobacterium sp. E-041]
MANKHFNQAPTHTTASIRFDGEVVPCAVLSLAGSAAHVRVFTTGRVPDEIAFVQDGADQRAQVALRKQGPLGLDLWLDLHAARDAIAA